MGYSGVNVMGGGGGGSNVFFWVEDLTVYFFGSEKSVRIFLGSNFRQANSAYAIQAKAPARSKSMIRIICMYLDCRISRRIKVMFFSGSKMSSLVFFWVHSIRSMYFFGCKILGSVAPTPPPPPPVAFIPK